MRLTLAYIAALALIAGPVHAQRGSGSGGGQGQGKAMQAGNGQRQAQQMKPLKRTEVEKVASRNFADADTNRDGLVTVDEIRAAIQARKNAAISKRFIRIDTNADRIIDESEFLTWQNQLGATVLGSDGQQLAEASFTPEVIPLDLDGSPGPIFLSRLVAPLSVTVAVAANLNYDAGVSKDELLAYHYRKFDEHDLDGNGELDRNELRALAPDMREAPAPSQQQGNGQQRGQGKGKGRGHDMNY